MSSLYIARNGAPCVMVKKVPTGRSYASFCIEHAMVFEPHEMQQNDGKEYHFIARNGKEYYFDATDVSIIKG